MGVLVALAVAGPLVALPASFLVSGEVLDQIAQTLLPQALAKSVLLGVGVAAGTRGRLARSASGDAEQLLRWGRSGKP